MTIIGIVWIAAAALLWLLIRSTGPGKRQGGKKDRDQSPEDDDRHSQD